MRRKIPKSTRAEINRISAEKQEMILAYMRKQGRPMSIKGITEALQLTQNDVRNQFGNLRIKNLLNVVGRDTSGYLYTINDGTGKGAYRNLNQEKMDGEAIWPEEIEKAKQKTKVGDTYIYLNEDGLKSCTRVMDTRYPHICLFDNQQSYTWADVARCRRSRKESVLGEWPR